MTTIETNVQILENKTLQIILPAGGQNLQPGVYHAVLIIEEMPIQPVVKQEKPPLKINTFKLEGWPADCTFRREDIYGDDGR